GEGPSPGGPGQAGDRLRAAGQGVLLRGVPAGDGGSADAALRVAQRRQLGRLLGAGGGLDSCGRGPSLRDYRQPTGAPGDGRLAVFAGAPTVGVCLPAEVRGVLEPDRAVVEGAAVAGPEGAARRELGTRG